MSLWNPVAYENEGGMKKDQRPSLWLLLPAGVAAACFMDAYRDWILMPLCMSLIVTTYLHRRFLNWPTRRGAVLWLFAGGFACTGCAFYHLLVLEGLSPLEPVSRRWWATPELVATLGMLMAVTLVAVWHLGGEAEKKIDFVVLLTGLVAISSGNFYNLSIRYLILLGCFFASTMAALVMARGKTGDGRGIRGRLRTRWGIATILCLLAMGVGTGVLAVALRSIEGAFMRLTAGDLGTKLPDFTGASSVGGLMIIERQSHFRPAQTIIAAMESIDAPGYLRTQVMTAYEEGRWKPLTSSSRRLEPISDPVSNMKRFHLSPVLSQTPVPHQTPEGVPNNDGEGSKIPSLTGAVIFLADLRGTVLLPYSATSLSTTDPAEFSITGGGVVGCDTPSDLTHYRFKALAKETNLTFGTGDAMPAKRLPDPATALPDAASKLLDQAIRLQDSATGIPEPVTGLPAVETDLPEEIKTALECPQEITNALRPLALTIAGGSSDQPLAAAQKIQDYFRQNFEYSFDVNLAEEGDPVVDFVLNRRPGYCEYYAAGMALMARSLGIPARVAGGFVVADYNSLAGQWVVRKSDAHAWCEIYDHESRRWVAFDGTPSSVTEPESRSGVVAFTGRLRDFLKLRVDALILRIRASDPEKWAGSVGEKLFSLTRRPALWILLFVMICVPLGWKGRRRIRSLFRNLRLQRNSRPAETGVFRDPLTQEATRLFEEVSRKLDHLDIPIQSSETVGEYLTRLESESGGMRHHESNAKRPQPSLLDSLKTFLMSYEGFRFRPRRHGAPDRVDLDMLASLKQKAKIALTQ